MNEHDDIDDRAAEYVLGTLTASERASVAARRQRESRLDAAISDWELRLAPLNDGINEVGPPSFLFSAIEARLARRSRANTGTVTDLTRRLKWWRAAALSASAIAAALVAIIGISQLAPNPRTKNLVAILQKDAQSPAFLVSVNIEDRVMTVRPVAAKREAGKSFELWIINDSLGKPKSLGVVDDAKPTRGPTLAAYKADVIADSTYAVTLEPEGGSPTGDPTGPVVFSGKMIDASNF
jgi:anti-sigma-K factor RskA